MQKRQMWFFILLIGLALPLLSCSSEKRPPDPIADKKYQITIQGGSGDMTSSGSAKIMFAKDGTYVVTGDGVNTANDNGTYVANKTGTNTVEFTLTSKAIPGYIESNIFVFDFKKNSGTFTAKTMTGDPGSQIGKFNEI